MSTNERAARLPASIWALGFVSLLMDVSSEMIHSILPLFMVGTLGASAVTVGLLEGLAEATALMVKVFSGSLSDAFRSRKSLAVAGYAVSAFTKLLFPIATVGSIVFAARLLDRVGKGVRGAPRDALVADLVPPEQRGAAFGLRHALDTVGAVLGPLIGFGLMVLWANDFHSVFAVAVVPAFASVLVFALVIREPKSEAAPAKRFNPLRREHLARLGSPFWTVVISGALFSLARFSEAFLVLLAQDRGLPTSSVPLVMVAMNVVCAAAAFPFGRFADRKSPRVVLMSSLVVLIAADVVLAMASGWLLVLLGVALFGLHLAASQGVLSALVANAAPADLRGTAFGCFNVVSGLALLVANLLAGALWVHVGSAATFLTGVGFAVLAVVSLLARPSTPNGQTGSVSS